MVFFVIPLARTRSSWDQLSKARAARHWAGERVISALFSTLLMWTGKARYATSLVQNNRSEAPPMPTSLPHTDPGWSGRLITGLPAAEYHALQALSASGAWLLAEECPAKFLWRSPWNPLYEPEAKTEFDIGVAAHLAVLEPERQARNIVLIEAGDYRTTKAREARDAARAEGKVPLLPYQPDIVRAITGSIRAHPIASQAFADGDAEVTLTWQDRETGGPLQCKAGLPAPAWALAGRSED